MQPDSASACKNATGSSAPAPEVKLEHAPGVLYPHPKGVETGRFAAGPELAAFVEHYWWVRWELEEPRVQEVLSYPSVHIVFEGSEARIVGIVRTKFSRRLEGTGAVCAIKFQPGMFRLLYTRPASWTTDQSLPLGSELGRDPAELAAELRDQPSEAARAKVLEETLRAVVPAPNPEAILARDLVNRVRTDSALRHAADLAACSGMTLRALQRLFREYVGVGPKWVVRRFRLQEAADLLRRCDASVASVAADLGYFDQAHFVHDFKAVVGSSPSDYVRAARRRGEDDA